MVVGLESKETKGFYLMLCEADNQKAWRIAASLAEVEDGHKVVGSITAIN
jgi:hypothetical protein